MLVISRIHYYRNQSIYYYNPILIIYFTAFYFFISQKVFRIPGDSFLEEARLSAELESLQHQERKVSSRRRIYAIKYYIVMKMICQRYKLNFGKED